MALTAERQHDLAVKHRIGLSRYSTYVVRRVLALLNRTDATLAERLLRTDNQTVAGQRLETLISELGSIRAAGWALIRDRMSESVRDLSGDEAKFALRLAGVSLEPAAMTGFSPVPPLEQIVAAVNARPFQGRLLREWIAGAEEADARRIRDAVRQGFVEGRTTPEIVRDLRGTVSAQFRDGALETSRRGAEAMVRTALTHTANVAAQAAWEANSDIVRAWRFVATLDSHTTLICASLHGKKFPLGKGPQPPRHINCRSTSVPVVDAIEGIGEFEFPTYEAWLKKQPSKVQDNILGAKKAALFRTGGMKVDRFVDNKGRTLTLDELRAQDAAAFETAGLNLPVKAPRGQPQDAIATFLADPAAQRALLTKLVGGDRDFAGHLSMVNYTARQKGWSAEPNDLVSIRHYTGASYGPINQRMRDTGGTLEDRQFTALAGRGVTDLPQEKADVWRAPRKRKVDADLMWDRARVGQDLDLGNQLQSFSRSKGFVATWAGQSDLIVHVRKPPAGAAHIEPISQNPGEEEVLFEAGLRYVVVELRTEQVNGRQIRVIEVEVAP